MRKKLIFIAPLAIAGFALFIALGGVIVQYLWNWLMPALFNVPTLTFWQAFGLLALCRILFGGFGRGFHRMGPSHRSPEDRERFRQAVRQRFGFGPTDGERHEP